ncbi:uncharacterized protein LOC110118533 [Ceratitis capitata]|uniref:Uncharacterized protein n=2 Tax=Ceratitis capitata TaxID=7213 RepID=W8CD08_CERCA|nr:uncharacterized protein LOC110118533 [Ceratitis capitata]
MHQIPPMSPTIKELCAKLLRERQPREVGCRSGQPKKKRTVRSAIITEDATPLIIKSLVEVPVHAARVDAHTADGGKRTETSLDQMIEQLHRGKWPSDVVVLITPASKHNNLYKLHVIDRKNEDHLGMTSITKKELAELRASNVFDKYATIVGNKYIDLKTVTMNTAIIANIMKNLNGGCCQEQQKVQCELPLTLLKRDSKEVVGCKSSSELEFEVPAERRGRRRSTQSRIISKYHTESGVHLMTLIDRINDAIQPSGTDLHNFFDLAETYKFKMYIRPELCWQPPPQASSQQNESDTDLVRFNVESFMLFDNYVCSIALNSLQLHEQLKLHPSILSRMEVIEDVCELTPLPKWFLMLLRTFAEWLGLEMFYDAFGEFIFDLYKHIT